MIHRGYTVATATTPYRVHLMLHLNVGHVSGPGTLRMTDWL